PAIASGFAPGRLSHYYFSRSVEFSGREVCARGTIIVRALPRLADLVRIRFLLSTTALRSQSHGQRNKPLSRVDQDRRIHSGKLGSGRQSRGFGFRTSNLLLFGKRIRHRIHLYLRINGTAALRAADATRDDRGD